MTTIDRNNTMMTDVNMMNTDVIAIDKETEDGRAVSNDDDDYETQDELRATGRSISPRTSGTLATASRSSGEALERQKTNNDVTNMFRTHSVSQHWATNKSAYLLSASLINDAQFLARVIDQPTSEFAKIAAACPLHASPDKRQAASRYVLENIDKFLNEINDALHAEQERAGTSPDAFAAARIHLCYDTFETLNHLAWLMMLRERRAKDCLKKMDMCTDEMTKNFDVNFNERAFGTLVNVEGASTCLGCAEDRPKRVRLTCCGATAMCVGCVQKHVYVNSLLGCRAVANCAFCRKEQPLYAHIDASPPGSPTKRLRQQDK